MRKGPTRGFTLIELLVVIAIIAILAAILFPVFARAKAKANQNNCLSNVKQIQLGMIMYASDYNQMYPIYMTCCGSNTSYWPNFIFPYVKNVQLFLCPSDAVVTGSINLGVPAQSPNMLSYGRNSYLDVGGNPPTYNIPDADPLIQYPAEMMGIIDAVYVSGYGGADVPTAIAGTWTCGTTFAAALSTISTGGLVTNTRHNQGCNQSYMDGHAKWIAFTNIPDPTSATTANRHYWYGID